MVTADFRPEAEFTLFLRKRTKQIAKSPGKYIPIEELLYAVTEIRVAEANGEVKLLTRSS